MSAFKINISELELVLYVGTILRYFVLEAIWEFLVEPITKGSIIPVTARKLKKDPLYSCSFLTYLLWYLVL
jgi:hypothetical protein